MIIIKIGGGKDINIEGIIKDLSELNEKFIIIHGANYFRDKLLKDLGKEKKILTSVSGYSSVFSDIDTIDAIMMSYSGLRNKRIVELCHQHGINAIGLSGIDGGLIKGRRNRGIRIKDGSKIKLIRDFSGKPKEINTELLNMLLENEYVPVICIPIIDENNYAINSENDDIINLLKNTLQARKIIQLIEAPGFLDNKDDPNSLVKKMSSDDLLAKEKQVQGRIKRKILALRKLFDSGNCIVYISDGRVEHPVKDALAGKGTVIK